MCVSLSVIRCNNNPLHLQWVGRRGQTKKERKKEKKDRKKDRKIERKKKRMKERKKESVLFVLGIDKVPSILLDVSHCICFMKLLNYYAGLLNV